MGKSYLREHKKFYLQDLLKHADEMRFACFQTFKRALQGGYLLPNSGRLIVPVETLLEIEKMQIIMEKSQLHKMSYIVLEMTPELFYHSMYSNLVNRNTIYESSVLGYLNEDIRETSKVSENVSWYITNNPVVQQVLIDKDNFRDELIQLVNEYTEKKGRLFDIRFDYVSLNELRFSDMEDLEFGMNHLMKWIITSSEMGNRLEFMGKPGISKAYYVTEDMDLKLVNKEGRTLISLDKYKDTFLEDIPFRELSNVTAVFDMSEEDLFFPLKPEKTNAYWIDLSANETIELFNSNS